jgi:hypothetical protein
MLLVRLLTRKTMWSMRCTENGVGILAPVDLRMLTELLSPLGAREMVGDKSICMAVSHLMLGLKPSDHFHMLPVAKRLKQAYPMANGLAVLLLD